ncbi:hypothetical protein MBANPS3_011262 [Mucor bainieri]
MTHPCGVGGMAVDFTVIKRNQGNMTQLSPNQASSASVWNELAFDLIASKEKWESCQQIHNNNPWKTHLLQDCQRALSDWHWIQRTQAGALLRVTEHAMSAAARATETP